MPRTSRHCNRLPARSRTTLIAQARVPDFIATSMVPPRSQMSDDAAVKQMANDFREAAWREGGMTEAGLLLKGYTKTQIATLAPRARIRADQLAGMT